MRAWPPSTGSAPIVDYLPAGGCGHTGLLRALASGQAERGQGGFRCTRLGGPRLPGAEVTAQVLQRALAAGHERRLWSALRDLDAAAGIAPAPPRTEPMMGQQGGDDLGDRRALSAACHRRRIAVSLSLPGSASRARGVAKGTR